MSHYTRQNTSEFYNELVCQFKELHEFGDKRLNIPASKLFTGEGVIPQVERIKELVEETEADTILDYGSGKGVQYEKPIVDMGASEKEFVLDYWDVISVDCYDPAVTSSELLPEREFDGVIAVDSLQCCAESDLEWILIELFEKAEKFVFASISSFEAMKCLPNGENTNITIKPAEWWRERVDRASKNFPEVKWRLVVLESNKLGNFSEVEFGSDV